MSGSAHRNKIILQSVEEIKKEENEMDFDLKVKRWIQINKLSRWWFMAVAVSI